MTLLVRAPNRYLPERRYVLDVVLKDWLGFDYELMLAERSDVGVRVLGDTRERELTFPDVLFATPYDRWLTEQAKPVPPLAHFALDAPGFARGSHSVERSRRSAARSIPILFGAPSPAGGAWQESSTGAAFSVDVFGSVFYLLTCFEEVAHPVHDEHDRFPASASLAAAEGFLDSPLADEHVEALWAAMSHVWPTLTRKRATFRLLLTHDVDDAWAAYGRPVAGVMHALAGDLLRRHDPELAVRRTRALVEARSGGSDHDPFNPFDFLMDTSERHGLTSTFFFMIGGTGDVMDGSYRLTDAPIRGLLRRIRERGHEIGLHASYASYTAPERTRVELTKLKEVCRELGIDQPTWGVRQHYLRFENPQTWRNQESAGLEYDSTLGYADRIGFRAGTSRDFPVFDLQQRRTMKLRERPLEVMDATLFDYMALGFDEAATRTKAIANAARDQEGKAVLLFHNSSLGGSRQRAYYRNLVEELVRPNS